MIELKKIQFFCWIDFYVFGKKETNEDTKIPKSKGSIDRRKQTLSQDHVIRRSNVFEALNKPFKQPYNLKFGQLSIKTGGVCIKRAMSVSARCIDVWSCDKIGIYALNKSCSSNSSTIGYRHTVGVHCVSDTEHRRNEYKKNEQQQQQ